MIRVLFLVLMLLSVSAEGAMGARWEKKEVPVWDFTPEEWRPYVQATVDDFNTNLPSNVPRLLYVPMGELACEKLPENGRRGGISVCVTDIPLTVPEASAENRRRIVGNRFVSNVMAYRNYRKASYGLALCHEMTHAVFDAPDDYSMPHPSESCVQGTLDHLGTWDIAYAERVYSRNGRSKHRHR